ncbi:hypothetical protein [Aquimarina sp. 2201CG14-23]|uniref:hypothetical protein n=1 Tax=Aquimarina mycalae TaxID=3040073 RepID=UPI0024780108|nr:hypothetical protein [Aquimarina sp. 2201CG14-23]MDH7444655.1 hypothetical protein [Aquimarina sp. 2201CG14-23]
MEGLISIPELMQHMKRENLVIAPAHLVMKEQTHLEVLRKKTLAKKSLAYSEIAKAKLWGDITQKRVYTIAKEFAKELEIIKPGNKCNSPEKIIISAVIRIAKQRNTYEN